MDYRTSDGTEYYDFLFWYYDDLETWRIYIINEINYPSNLVSNFHATHRLHDPEETYHYICWSNCIESLEDAKKIAAMWADVTTEMLRTGRPFDVICLEKRIQ